MIQLDEWNIDELHHEIEPQKKQCLGYEFLFFSVGKKTQPTQGEKIICMARTKSIPTGRESILSGKKILSVLHNNRRGPLPSFISANYIAVLQKGGLKPHSRQSG
jgi:hypothetical protein